MSSTVEDIVFELETTFMFAASPRNSVKTSDGKIVRVGLTLRNASRILRKHLAEGQSYFMLNVPEKSVLDLLDALKTGKLPSDCHGLLALVSVSRQLGLQRLMMICFKVLCERKGVLEGDYSPACPTATALLCFETLLETPLREVEIYKEQLTRIAKLCNFDQEVMGKALQLMREKLSDFGRINLEGIPISFKKVVTPIVIFRFKGFLRAGVIDDDTLKSVNLFGKYFNLESANVENYFHLKYGAYVLYKSGSCVYHKNLRNDSSPAVKLTDCTFFLKRGDFVFAVRKDGDSHLVLRWMDDEKFSPVYRTDLVINKIDFECHKRVLAVHLLPETVLLLEHEEGYLALIAEYRRPDMVDMLFHDRKMLVVRKRCASDGSNPEDGILETYPLMGDAHGFRSQPLAERLMTTMKSAGNNIFIVEREALKIFKRFPHTQLPTSIVAKGEIQALSELSLVS